MFLFISATQISWLKNIHLNTSHVLIYLFRKFAFWIPFIDLNTSHVLIYHANFNKDCWYVTLFKYISCSYLSGIDMDWNTTDFIFKYISCSYLSIQGKWGNGQDRDLNTSHVLIYPELSEYANYRTAFKYISCSYLSNVFTHFLFSIISYIALFFNISQLFYQPPPHFSFSSSLVSFPLIL